MRILVVAAHPDDEVLGCGGTIARLSQTNDVAISILGEGATSRLGGRPSEPTDEVQALRRASENAKKVLGARDLFMSGLPDNRFDELPLIEIVKTIENIITEVKPEAIYTHHPGDLNIDHQLCYRAVVTATRPGASTEVAEVSSFEIPSSSEWSFGTMGGIFVPNLFVDIADSIDRKIEAMHCYDSEMRPFPHPRSETTLRALASVRGSAANMQAAEAFQVVRMLR